MQLFARKSLSAAPTAVNFTNGIGFVVIVSRFFADSIQRQREDYGVLSYVISDVRDGEADVEWH